MNEREIADGFSAVWADCFPMLSPTFVIAFNRAFVRHLAPLQGIELPIPAASKSHRPDMLAEFSFRLAASAYSVGETVAGVAASRTECDMAMSIASKRIQAFRPKQSIDQLALNEAEQNEAVQLASVYEHFCKLFPTEPATYSPALKGYGVISSCAADLSIGQTLFEVKTVSRPFQGRDIRQLLVYLALQFASGSSTWNAGGLLNPRIGTYCTFDIAWLVGRLTGGRPPQAVFKDFLEALSRDYVSERSF